MDLKSILEAQLAKKASTSKATDPTKQFRTRREIEAERVAAYNASQAAASAAREEQRAQKRKHEDDERERNIVRREKMARLAAESKIRREEEAAEEERQRRKRLGLPELVKEQVKEEAKAVEEQKTVYEASIPTTLEPVPEKDMKVASPALPSKDDEAAWLFLRRQLGSYFNMIFREWTLALATRDDDVKNSSSGKQALNTMILAKTSLRPFFRKLENNDLPDDLLAPVTAIVHAAQERRYVDANNVYLKLSIGNAAWPIGVTMVGIHERSAREKLHDGATAHIMADETTRKYIQGIKRCLTFAQTRWPPEDVLQLMG